MMGAEGGIMPYRYDVMHDDGYLSLDGISRGLGND